VSIPYENAKFIKARGRARVFDFTSFLSRYGFSGRGSCSKIFSQALLAPHGYATPWHPPDGNICSFHSQCEIGIALVENKRSRTAAEDDLAVEAGAAASVAGAAVATGFDRHKQRVLIAIGSDFRDFLNLAGCIALSPERLA
jgi:hypothetical protein